MSSVLQSLSMLCSRFCFCQGIFFKFISFKFQSLSQRMSNSAVLLASVKKDWSSQPGGVHLFLCHLSLSGAGWLSAVGGVKKAGLPGGPRRWRMRRWVAKKAGHGQRVASSQRGGGNGQIEERRGGEIKAGKSISGGGEGGSRKVGKDRTRVSGLGGGWGAGGGVLTGVGLGAQTGLSCVVLTAWGGRLVRGRGSGWRKGGDNGGGQGGGGWRSKKGAKEKAGGGPGGAGRGGGGGTCGTAGRGQGGRGKKRICSFCWVVCGSLLKKRKTFCFFFFFFFFKNFITFFFFFLSFFFSI